MIGINGILITAGVGLLASVASFGGGMLWSYSACQESIISAAESARAAAIKAQADKMNEQHAAAVKEAEERATREAKETFAVEKQILEAQSHAIPLCDLPDALIRSLDGIRLR